MSRCQLTVLCENSVSGPRGLTGEHGFSVLIEKDDQKILFDTGQGMSLAGNAKILQKDLSLVQTVILSHGHYDHTGGLPSVLYPPRGVKVIAHPDIFNQKYAQRNGTNGICHDFIGIKYKREFLEASLKAEFMLISEFTEIRPGIYFSGQIPRKTDFEQSDTRLKTLQDGNFVLDPLLDDISLLIETDKGPVILLGCAHAGLVNIMNHFADKTGYSKFHAVIGGTHLGFLKNSEEQLQKSMDAFDHYQVDLIAVAHCTGQEVAAVCYNRFKDRFAFACTGWSKTF